MPKPPVLSPADLPRSLAVGLGLVVLGVLAWRLADLILMAFAAVILALVVHVIAEPLRGRLRLGPRVAVSAVLTLLACATGATGWLFGSQLSAQFAHLAGILPPALETLRRDAASSPIGPLLSDGAMESLSGLTSAKAVDLVTGMAGGVAPAMTAAVIVTFVGVYLAYNPATYRDGAMLLIPPGARGRTAQVVEACRRALTLWLRGQLVSVVFVASFATLGLWAVGAPAPLALGLFAGLGQLVPVVGPTAAALLGALVALPYGLPTLGRVAAIYVVITQAEANLLTPLVLRSMAQVPMAVTLFAVMAMGMLFGALGVLLATPLAVVAYVLVRELYVRDALGESLESAAS